MVVPSSSSSVTSDNLLDIHSQGHPGPEIWSKPADKGNQDHEESQQEKNEDLH